MIIKMNSKEKHINQHTGFEVSNESWLCFGCVIDEDDKNYYVCRSYPSDNNDPEVFPKSSWDAEVW